MLHEIIVPASAAYLKGILRGGLRDPVLQGAVVLQGQIAEVEGKKAVLRAEHEGLGQVGLGCGGFAQSDGLRGRRWRGRPRCLRFPIGPSLRFGRH